MDWPLLLFVLLPCVLVLALCTLLYGGLALGETRRIRALARTRPAAIAEAVGAGPVVVAGTIEAEDLVRSPVTGEEGVYVVCMLEAPVTHTRYTHHNRRETVQTRRPIGEARLRGSFWVRDDSGRAYVETAGAELVGTDWEPSERTLSKDDMEQLPEAFRRLVAEHADEIERVPYVLYTEYVARPDDPVVLEGTAKTMPSRRGGYRANVTGFSASAEHPLRVENQTLDERIAAIRVESRRYWRIVGGFSVATALVLSLLWWAR